MSSSYPPEYLFITPSPTPQQVQALIEAVMGGPPNTQLSYQLGQDALGRTRCTLTLHGPDREAVATLRGQVTAYCRAQGWKAIVV